MSTLRLLYWIFFKPFTLDKYIRSFDSTLSGKSTLIALWRRGKEQPPLRQLVLQALFHILVTPWILYGLLSPILFLVGVSPENIIRGLVVGVTAGVGLGAVTSMQTDVVMGVAIGVAFGVALGVVFNAAGGVVVGRIFGVMLGVVVSIAFGVVIGVTLGTSGIVATGMVFGVLAGATGGMLAGATVGVAGGLAVGVVVGVAFILSYFRLYFYLPELAIQWMLTRHARSTQVALRTWRFSPIHFDELIWLPLLGLDDHLLSILLADRDAGAKAIAKVAGSFRQSWAARKALLEITALDVEGARDIASIAEVAQTLTWLPTELPPELESFLPTLRQIAERVRAALESDTDANRLEQIERAGNEVASLRQAQAWGNWAKVGARYMTIRLNVWQAIIDREFDRLRLLQTGQLAIPNYYVAGNPLADQSRVFKGRRDLFNMLERELAAQPEARPALLLLGPRRGGKTSTLRQLPSRLGPDFIPVEVDMLSSIVSESSAGMLGAIAERIADSALLNRRIKLPRLDKDSLAADPYVAFNRWLESAESAIGEKLLLLTLDEYERVETMIDEGRLDKRIYAWLRTLIQNHPKTVVLLSGAHDLQELAPEWSDALINVRTLRLSPLTESEAHELITKPVPNFPLEYEPEAVEAILRESGRQPYLIQVTCRDLVNHLNEVNRRNATRADVEAAFDSALQTGAAYFAELWTSRDTDDSQRAVLRLLAQTEMISEDDLTRRAQLPSLTPLKRLIGRDLIEHIDGGYRLRAGLVGRWVRMKNDE